MVSSLEAFDLVADFFYDTDRFVSEDEVEGAFQVSSMCTMSDPLLFLSGPRHCCGVVPVRMEITCARLSAIDTSSHLRLRLTPAKTRACNPQDCIGRLLNLWRGAVFNFDLDGRVN